MKILTTISLSLMLIGSVMAQNTPQLGKAKIDEVIAAMTPEEKAMLVTGTGMAGFSGNNPVIGATQNLVPGAAGTTWPIPRLGIPAIVLADGPAGLRITPVRPNDSKTYYCTAFPIATLLASTWNTALVEQVGKAMGNEVLEYGVDVLLAPALNIHRNPLCGRNFEYYSEDPLVAGKMTAAMVRGVQSNGVGTSIKHFAANNQETNRMGNDAQISQRAIREIYLRGFEIAVKESAPWTVMSSYNRINGTFTSESKGLLSDILRDEWGYKGLVMTDWFGGKDAVAQMIAGNDLLMPGIPDQQKAILNALQNGSLKMDVLDRNVKRILELIVLTPRFKGYKYSNSPDLKAHAQVTRQSATEGMVLLKNEGNTLPLPASVKHIAAYGITSYEFITGGTGSGDVNKAYSVSLAEGLSNAGWKLDNNLKAVYEAYIKQEKDKVKTDANPFAAFLNKKRIPEMVPDQAQLTADVASSDVAIITLGRSSGEFTDRKITDDFELTANEQQLIGKVTEAFKAKGKKTIVILNIGGVIETQSWKGIPDAILLAWQAGQEGGNSVADILAGKANPSGKLTMTFPLAYSDVPSSKDFPFDYIVDPNKIMNDMMNKNKQETHIANVDYTPYSEDIFVGYRYYSTFSKPVSFPFGFGLSYTGFKLSGAKISTGKSGYTATVKVTNSGKRAGKEVVQLYVTLPGQDGLKMPAKELKAFAKTTLLNPGASQTITLSLSAKDMEQYAPAKNAWITAKGEYRILIGTSSEQLSPVGSITIEKESIRSATHDVLNPATPLKTL